MRTPKRKPRRRAQHGAQIALRLPKALAERVDLLAAEAVCPRSHIIRSLIRKSLESGAR